jgi:hypothetical protein
LFWCDYACLATSSSVLISTTYLQVTELSELLSAVIQSARERFDLLVNDLVCTDVATLGKSLAADVTAVWSLSSMAPLMRLEMRSATV